MGSPRVGHDWATSLSLFPFVHWRRKWQPTPVFLPGKLHGQRSLVGYSLCGCIELNTTEHKARIQTSSSSPSILAENYIVIYDPIRLYGLHCYSLTMRLWTTDNSSLILSSGSLLNPITNFPLTWIYQKFFLPEVLFIHYLLYIHYIAIVYIL